MEGTEWEKYGVGNYEKCANCMVHCGFEGTAAHRRDQASAEDAADPLRGVKTEGPMAPDIPLDNQRPAEFVFSRHVEHKLSRSGQRQVQHHRRSRQRSKSANALLASRAVRIKRRNLTRSASAANPAPRPCAMPPSGFIATSAAGGSDMERIVGNDPQGRERQVAQRRHLRGDARFHVDGVRRPSPSAARLSRLCPRPCPSTPAIAPDLASGRRPASPSAQAVSVLKRFVPTTISRAMTAVAHAQVRRQRARNADADDAADVALRSSRSIRLRKISHAVRPRSRARRPRRRSGLRAGRPATAMTLTSPYATWRELLTFRLR